MKPKRKTIWRETFTHFQYLDEILKNLTPDDIRCLLITEDELARSAPLERIFPSSITHKYLQFIESPRYYNRLLDAWEHRYGGGRREKGIALIRKFCEDKVHLTVPPQPAKKVNDFSNFSIFFFSNRFACCCGLCSSTSSKLLTKFTNEPTTNPPKNPQHALFVFIEIFEHFFLMH